VRISTGVHGLCTCARSFFKKRHRKNHGDPQHQLCVEETRSGRNSARHVTLIHRANQLSQTWRRSVEGFFVLWRPKAAYQITTASPIAMCLLKGNASTRSIAYTRENVGLATFSSIGQI
jgi:hypothetical protein